MSDLNFQNEVLLVIASKKNSIFDSKVARYPRWLDSGRIAYKTVSLEGVESCGVVSRDGTSNKVFAETKDATVYPLISGDFLARYDNGKGIALIDTNTDGKQYITEALLESEGFSYDKNGKWVSYFRLNKEKSKKKEKSGSEGENGSSSGNSGGSSSGNSSGSGGSSGGSGGGEDSKKSEWTAKFEIVGITSDSTLYEFETDKQSVRPIEDAVASADGKILLFTDIDKTGRRVLYKLDIDSESVKAEEGKGEESS